MTFSGSRRLRLMQLADGGLCVTITTLRQGHRIYLTEEQAVELSNKLQSFIRSLQTEIFSLEESTNAFRPNR